jgi:hypothetical protein
MMAIGKQNLSRHNGPCDLPGLNFRNRLKDAAAQTNQPAMV